MKLKRNQFKGLISNLLTLVIIFVLTYLYSMTWTAYYALTIPDPFWNKGNWLVIAIYAFMLYIFMKVYGTKNIGDWKIIDIIYSQCLTVLMVNGFTFLQIALLNRSFPFIRPLIWLTIFDFVCVIAWTIIAKSLHQQMYPPRKMLMVYGKFDPDHLISKMKKREDKYSLCEYININMGIEIVTERIKQYESILICDLPSETRNDILKFCFENSIRVYVAPKISDVIMSGAVKNNTFDSPLLICKNRGISMQNQIIKRIMDLVVIIPVAIVTLPFMIISSLIIKLYDGGPVFYKQKRLTFNGKIFEIYKFRSMKTDSEVKGAQLAKKDDDRITPIGKILRLTHLDELPQIINIIKGEMSVVGPRPERPEIAEQYKKEIPEFDFRLMAKAGLTGYAQVFGKYNTTPYDKLKLDLFYIEQQSLMLDLELILKTVRILAAKETSEGVDDDQITAIKEKRD